MAITTLDGAATGAKPPVGIIKTGVTMAAAGVYQRAWTPWYTAGIPGASAANSAGVNGQAVNPSLGASVDGRIPRTNPVSGNAHLHRLSGQFSQIGSLWLIDRLWQNSGLSVTSTTAQAITPATPAARDANGTSNGASVYAGIEWSAAGGAGTPTVTLTYTDQDGNTGVTGTFTGVASPPAGTVEIFSLAAGDTGVRVPTSFIQSATRTSGTMHLILFRVLAMLEVNQANMGAAIDFLTGGAPRLYDDSTLQLLWFNSATTALSMAGTYVETQG